MQHEIKTIRVYDLNSELAGCRILVDRLWPRGLRKEALEPFLWRKEIAPSTELRKWFGHDPERFTAFSALYQVELSSNPSACDFLQELREVLQQQDVLLLYAAKDKAVNHAVVLKNWLEDCLEHES